MKASLFPTLLLLLSVSVGCQKRAASTETATPPAAADTAQAPVAATPDSLSPPQPAAVDTADEPAAVLRRYYAAINARDYRTAYAQWSGNGEASKQTFEQFAAGFAQTKQVTATVGVPGSVEGAAGSRYVEVPVEVSAATTNGKTQRFSGTYTLRKTVVDGATAEQRRWHLYSAELKKKQ